MVKYTCEKCESEFNNKTAYDRHLTRITDCSLDLNKKKIGVHGCEYCKKKFSRKDTLSRHLKICTAKINIQNSNNKTTTNSKNKNIKKNNIKGNNNVNNSNNTNITINNNIQLPIAVEKSHLDDLTFDDEIAIFNSKENPMIMIITLTHLAKDKYKFHNVGYIDKHSGTGYICKGKKFIETPIKYILRTVFESRYEDLEALHCDLKEYFTDKVNQRIKEKLEHMRSMLWGNPKDPKQSEKYIRDLRSLNAVLKNLLYTHRNLFEEAYERTNKLNGDDDCDDIPEMEPTENIFKISAKTVRNDRNQKKKSIDLKKEMATRVIKNMEKDIATRDYKPLIDTITKYRNIDTLNAVNRLLCKSYCFNNKISCDTIKKEIEKDALIEEMVFSKNAD